MTFVLCLFHKGEGLLRNAILALIDAKVIRHATPL
jgi:hypothetical protein